MSFIPLLQDAATAAQGSQNPILTFAPFILIIVIFYFFIIRPQNKKQKEAEKMRNSLSKGDKVVTIGGIHGTVSAVKERTVILKVEDGSKIEFDRAAISTVVSDKNKKDSDKKEESESTNEKSESSTEAETKTETTENK